MKWKLEDVFLHEYHGPCCSCCAGVCAGWELGKLEPGVDLIRVGKYITDRYVMVDESLLDTAGLEIRYQIGYHPDWTVGSEPGPESVDLFIPARAALLMRHGVHISQPADGTTRCELWLNEVHIGFIMPTRQGAVTGATLDKARSIMRIVERRDSWPKFLEALVSDLAEHPVNALFAIEIASAQMASLSEVVPSDA